MEILLPKIEEEILKFWKNNRIFEKTLEKNKGKKRFVFYEGPPFANGLPGIHHLLARAFKDAVVRYKTMQGFLVERKAGWDAHGLPTEMAAEKSLGIKNKREIEADIERFIEECRKNVFTYKQEWEQFTERIGYWLDLKNAYVTCDNEYIESLWSALKRIYEKNLLRQDYRVGPYCPRCGTSISSHEVAQGYKTTKENSIFVKFPLKNEKNTYFLVWTTTPWTLPANTAIAINENIVYIKAKVKDDILILAKDRMSVLPKEHEILGEMTGKNLLNKEYEPLFNFSKPDKKAYFLVPGDFVSTEEGTGLVHIAPAFGEDDMKVCRENNLPIILNVDSEGKFKDEVKDFSGQFVKEADPLIVKNLKERNLLFREEDYTHEYPFCWRCDSPLLYYAKLSWFIEVTKIKKELIKENEKINWIPAYLKDGRFGEWLRELKDWNLSRERYWGTPLPIWECEKCRERICVGSIKELKEKSGISEIKDLHRPYIDKVVLACQCGGKMKRVPEVIDCWFDSGSMPFAQHHIVLGDNDDKNASMIYEKSYPADFICEGIDQTRGWFFTLLVISKILGLESSYKNVAAVGIVLDAKSQKMSKSKGNVVKPLEVADKYGADVARMYFYTVNGIADSKRFDLKDLESLYNRFFNPLINSVKFYELYGNKSEKPFDQKKVSGTLNKWIISRVENLNLEIIKKLDVFDIVSSARLFLDFIDELSNQYIKHSRKVFQNQGETKEKEEASMVLKYVLLKFLKLLAPFTPFLSDNMYRSLNGGKESVHLEDYPVSDKNLIDEKLEEKMARAKEIISLTLQERARLKKTLREPLKELIIGNLAEGLEIEITNIIKGTINVSELKYDPALKEKIKLDDSFSQELKEKWWSREIIRHVQQIRKELNLKPEDKIKVSFSGDKELCDLLKKNKEEIIKEARLQGLEEGESKDLDLSKEVLVDNKNLILIIKKIN
jgi:isoleucyl-tRNA synthetase